MKNCLGWLWLMDFKSGFVLSFQVCVHPGWSQSAPGPFWNRKWFNCGEYFSPCYKICFTFRTSHILFSSVFLYNIFFMMKMRMPLYIQDNLGLGEQIYVMSKHKIQITVLSMLSIFWFISEEQKFILPRFFLRLRRAKILILRFIKFWYWAII